MKKLLGIVVLSLFASFNNSIADHTNEHTITVSCQVAVGHSKGTEDIGPVDIRFNKKNVSISWMGDISKTVKLQNLRPGSSYFSVKKILDNYRNGKKTDNYMDFYKKYQPVSFINYAMRPYKNISTTDSTLVALSEKYQDEDPLLRDLSLIIYLNRVEAVGRMILRMKYDKNIRYPVMNYSDGTKYFELQTYLLEYCKLKRKKF